MGAFLHPSLPSMLRQNVSPLRPELAYLANVASQLPPGTHLWLPYAGQVGTHAHPVITQVVGI